MTLADLADRLGAFAGGQSSDAELQRWLDTVLAADSLGVEQSDSAPWDEAPDDARLFWRLVYLFEGGGVRAAGVPPAPDGAGGAEDENGQGRRRLAHRVHACLTRTASAATTFELLPLVTDQERFCAIVGKHACGVISRTGFLSVLAESGYPPHVKVWLEHAEPTHLARLCDLLERGAYDEVARALERKPG